MTAERVTIATPLRHFSDPTNEYKHVFCEHWAQVSGKSVRGRTRSQAKLIWVLVDSEAFRDVTWGYVRLEKKTAYGFRESITKMGGRVHFFHPHEWK